jgi:hypothetical protein
LALDDGEPLGAQQKKNPATSDGAREEELETPSSL